MTINTFTQDYFDELTEQAKTNDRLRQHRNVHKSYEDQCQRLFNAIEPNSYIRPHRHASDPRDEMLIAIRGLMALIVFDDIGNTTNVYFLGTERYGSTVCSALEIPSNSWHTVVALDSGCVLLEVKAGPFDPDRPKDLAPWAPPESTREAHEYLIKLIQAVRPAPKLLLL